MYRNKDLTAGCKMSSLFYTDDNVSADSVPTGAKVHLPYRSLNTGHNVVSQPL